MPFKIGTITTEPADGGGPPPQHVSISTAAASIIIALVTVVPTLVTTGVDWLKNGNAAQEQVQVQREKNLSDRNAAQRTAEAAWIKAALEIHDDQKRQAALKFLVDAGLVSRGAELENAIKSVPQFPSATGTSMLEK